ncbi:hypothetical protein REPUB_Repub07fG0161200 [Reevesia pubescens]
MHEVRDVPVFNHDGGVVISMTNAVGSDPRNFVTGNCSTESGTVVVLVNNMALPDRVSAEKRGIRTKAKIHDIAQPFRFTGVYGHPDTGQRKNTWNLLQRLRANSFLPSICEGDFNELPSDDEKLGGAIRPMWQMNAFRQVILDCDLSKVPVQGPLYTWSRRQEYGFVYERLDRALVSNLWLQHFPDTVEDHLVATTSDYLLIIVHMDK